MSTRARNLTTIALSCVMAILLCLVQTASAVATQSLEKTASGNFFADSDIRTEEIASQSLQPQWEIDLSPTQTASGRRFWLSADPIGESGGINLYGYVRGNPVNSIDPLGLDRWVVGGLFHKSVVFEDPSSSTGYSKYEISITAYLKTETKRPKDAQHYKTCKEQDVASMATIDGWAKEHSLSDKTKFNLMYGPAGHNCRHFANWAATLNIDISTTDQILMHMLIFSWTPEDPSASQSVPSQNVTPVPYLYPLGY